VLDRGATVVAGTPPELAQRFWPRPIVRFRGEHGPELDRLSAVSGVVGYQRRGNTATLELDRADRVGDLVLALSLDGVRLAAVEPYQPSLEDVYFAVLGHPRAARPAGSPSLRVVS
jgi:hypothetical protein